MGMGAFLGGMMTLTPEWRQPRMAPPLASTMKLTRNLETEQRLVRGCESWGQTQGCLLEVCLKNR